MLCGPGYCNCFHHWGNIGLNFHHSHTKRHTKHSRAKTQQIHDFSFLFSGMQSITCLAHAASHTVRDLLHTLHEDRGVDVRMSCYFVNVWCCKLFIWVLSLIWCFQQWILEWKSWHEKVNKYTNTFQLPNMTLLSCNVYFVLYRQSDRPLICSVFLTQKKNVRVYLIFIYLFS